MERSVGILLIVVGMFGLVCGAYSYAAGPPSASVRTIDASSESFHNVPLPPVTGAVTFMSGLILVASGKKA